MSNKKNVEQLADWDEVDQVLRKMGEIDIQIAKYEGEMTLRINEVREVFDQKAEGLKAIRKGLEESVIRFAEDHKADFVRSRTRVLTFGSVGYRLTEKIVIRAKAATVAAMKALGLTEYLRVIEEPNKEAMQGLDDGTLAKVGATRKKEDKLRIEPNLERLKEAA